MISAWQEYLSPKRNVYNLLLTFSILIPVLIFLPIYLTHIETREGFAFTDPLLNLFQPVDLTWWTFIIIYLGLILAVFHLRSYPNILLLALKVYTITAVFRIIAMYFLPLNPPSTIILLNDPFVQFFGSGEILTKDLFFSGHTSTMFIFYLTARDKVFKNLFLIGTILVGAFVLLQHVHYTIDVIAAPFFGYGAFMCAKLLNKKFEG